MANVTKLENRARFYANILSILFTQQNLTGATLKEASRGARHLTLGVKLNNPTDLDRALGLAEPIALASNVENILAQRQAGLVVYQYQLNKGFWESYTRADLPDNKSVGLAEKRRAVHFSFDPPHCLVAGTSGSGKSETIKSVLISLMTTYKPNELGIVLCDLHGDYGDFANEVHLLLPIAQTQEDIQAVLLYCNQELARRKAGNIRDGSILLLVMDEADKILLDDARLAIMQSLTQEGRKYHCHVILGTQKPSHGDLPNILDNLLNRFVGLVSDGKVSANLTGHAGLQAHKLTGAGDFLHVQGVECQRFQVAQAGRDDFDRLARGEIKSVVIEPDLIELPTELPDRQAGRPKLELNPDYVAWYLFHYPDQISRAVAKELLNISRDNHDLHSGFTQKVIEAYLRLQSQRLQIGA